MIEPKTFAANTIALLQDNPERYKLFGVYWYLVKEMLKRFYTRENLYMLGDYSDITVIERMPPMDDLQQALEAIVAEYQENASFNLGRSTIVDRTGEAFTLYDPDAGI